MLGSTARRSLVVGALVLVAASPVLVAVLADPSVDASALPASTAPALPPIAGGGTVDLSDALDPLPIVVVNLPDGVSTEAAAALRGSSTLEPGAALHAFETLWSAATGPAPDPAVEPLHQLLLHDNGSYGDLLDQTVRPAFAQLARDPANAGRLTDAAVALFELGVAEARGRSFRLEDPTFYEYFREADAVAMLRTIIDTFGPTRAALLDLAYLASVADHVRGIADGTRVARQAVHSFPTDMTARALLAELEARRPGVSSPQRDALRTLRPMSTASNLDAARVHALRGDAYLHAASERRIDAMATAVLLARHAVREYDAALARVADAGVYAGRARALDIMGDPAAADESMARAAALAPTSLSLQLARAAMAERAGRPRVMRRAARASLAHALGEWNPHLTDVRFVRGPGVDHAGFFAPGDLGYLGASIGSERDVLDVVQAPEGGAYLADLDLVRRVPDPVTDDWRELGFAPDVAAAMTVEASAVMGDIAGARADAAQWAEAALGTTRLGGDGIDDADRMTLIGGDVSAAELLQGGTVVGDEQVARRRAQVILRRFGRVHDLVRRCRTWRDHGCAGDALALEGRFARAAAEYRAGLAGRGDEELLVRAGWATLRTGDGAAAAADFELAIAEESFGEGSTPETALALLGDDELRAGHVDAAKFAYDLALARLAVAASGLDPADEAGQAHRREIIVHLRTNRALVTLRLAQPAPEEPPSCTSSRASPCARARADLRVALAIDPANAAALIDLGWAERASGHARAARTALRRATEADPRSFPAYNDLGVLRARAGDRTGARHAFRGALAADPRYALAEWNLGVLDLEDGPLHYVSAQQHFARAINREPALGDDPPELKTDERIYRSTFGGLQRVDVGWSAGRVFGAGAVALGAAGFLAAMGRLFGLLMRGSAGVTELWERAVAAMATQVGRSRLAYRLRDTPGPTRTRFRRYAGRGAPWVAAGAVLIVVATVTAWREPGSTVLATMIGVILASSSALAVHEIAHLLAAYRRKARLVPKQWIAGSVLALVLLPFRLGVGPFFAEHFDDTGDRGSLALHAVGPLANLVFAAVLGGLYFWHPAPFVLLAATINLAVAGYSLLPQMPLDGKVIADERPLLYAGLTLVTGAAGAALLVAS